MSIYWNDFTDGEKGDICQIGYFCNSGSEYTTPCLSGKYCPSTGMIFTDLDISKDCSAGFYCIEGSTTPNPTDNIMGSICPTGSYCPSGSKYPVPCKLGFFNIRHL